jgi:hypothetical protein
MACEFAEFPSGSCPCAFARHREIFPYTCILWISDRSGGIDGGVKILTLGSFDPEKPQNSVIYEEGRRQSVKSA